MVVQCHILFSMRQRIKIRGYTKIEVAPGYIDMIEMFERKLDRSKTV